MHRIELAGEVAESSQRAGLPVMVAWGKWVGAVARRSAVQHEGLEALRALWRAERAGFDAAHPLGERTADIEVAWHRYLDTLAPAIPDTVRLQREGC